LSPVKYIFVDSQKEKAIGLKDELNTFKEKFDRSLNIEIHIAQIEKKELDDLMRILGENRLPLRKPCMEGTRTTILQEIEDEIKDVNGPNIIWIRGSPGVGKSALAASIAIRLEDQNRHVISFRFDRTQSTTITTNALWRAVACDLARLYPSLRSHLTQGTQGHSSSDIDRLFKSLIEEPLSALDDNVPREELPVIVIDALDECGGLRQDVSGKEDLQGLLRTLKCWIQADHLKKFKLVITSRPEDRITLPDSISVYEIPSGHGVKPEDSVSNDIRIFLKSRLDDMKMKPAWIAKALDFLVPGAAGIFIWATTVANFLERDPEGRFAMLEKGDGKGLKSLYSLYSTIIEASFGHDLEEEEARAVISVMGAMIFARQPLDDNTLIMLPKVKVPGSDADRLGLIRKGLVSIIDIGPILRFHHRSFEDFLLSPSFLQDHPEFSAIQDRVHQEHQLTVLCLRTLVSSKLHFNMCSLESSIVKNVDIQASVRSAIPPLVSYSCQYWADHLVHTPSDETLVDAVKFVIYEKLLFWMEAMSLLGKTYEASLILRRALSWKVRLQFICCRTSLMLAGQNLNPDHELTLFIRDALRFISAFIIPISQCAPQIYVSALSFAPEQSLVATKFRSRLPNTIEVTEGKPSQWPMVVFTAEHHKGCVQRLVFSHDESTFASISVSNDTSDDTTENTIMCICDSETGHCISGPFELPSDEFVYGVCFSPDGKHIMIKFKFYAVVLDIETGEEQFRIKGEDFVYIHHDRRIASMHWIDKDGNITLTNTGGESEDEGGYPTRIVIKLWDAGSGALISNRLFEVDDVVPTPFSYVTRTHFSPDGRLLAVRRKSESVVELWNLEDGKEPQRFSHPPGNLSLFIFSPTSDSLMSVSWGSGESSYLWRLDTQEMTSVDGYFGRSHIIHSPLTNYLIINRPNTVGIWDVSVNGSEQIWGTDSRITSEMHSICPSRDGHRLLVGCKDGSVKMWELDLEKLSMNRAGTMDTESESDSEADADMPQVIAFLHSEMMLATKSERSVEFLDTTTGEVVSRVDFANNMAISFSPDEDQAAFWSDSLVIVCDIMHPDNRVSFDPCPGKDVRIREVAFQTCNDLVVCASGGYSALLQVWHRQGPARFNCTYSLDIKSKSLFPLLAPDGFTVVVASSSSSTKCYSWNHDSAQFRPVDFDDHMYIDWPEYSPDGRLFACWSRKDSHVRVWDTRTGQRVGKFRTSKVDEIALSPALIKHSPGNRLIALWCNDDSTICLFGVYTGHLYAQISHPEKAHMEFIGDGTKLAYYHYHSDFGLRIWDIADLLVEPWHSTHGYELILQGMRDGWVMGRDNEPLFWVPVEHRNNLWISSSRSAFGMPRTSVDLSNSRLGRKWTDCIDKEWLRELEQKEKVGNLLEKYVLFSGEVV